MSEPAVPGRALVERITRQPIPPGAVGVWWLGQSSLVLKAAETIVYVDPYLVPAERRLTPPPFPAEAVEHADLVLCTHDHGDHIDPVALPAIAAASPRARFVVPRPAAERVAGLVGDAPRGIPPVAGGKPPPGGGENLPRAGQDQ